MHAPELDDRSFRGGLQGEADAENPRVVGSIALENSCVETQNFCMSQPPSLDEFDHRLLELLQADAALTLTALGEAVGLSASAVQRRIERHRRAGLLREVAVLDANLLPAVTLVAAWVRMERGSAAMEDAFRARMRAAPEVQQCYAVAGAWDYLVLIAATSVAHYRQIAARLFLDDGAVKRYETQLVFDVVKQGLALPTRATPRRRR